MNTSSNVDHNSAYRLELLPEVPAFCRAAREKNAHLQEGELVYYGPHPVFYGIGEVKRVAGPKIAVDFRGTGDFGVHEEIMDQRYLVRIPPAKMERL
jgi:hypothetical protein